MAQGGRGGNYTSTGLKCPLTTQIIELLFLISHCEVLFSTKSNEQWIAIAIARRSSPCAALEAFRKDAPASNINGDVSMAVKHLNVSI